MTEDQIIRGGALALQRRSIRAVSRDALPLTISVKGSDGRATTLALDIHSTRAALDAIDLELSNRLSKLGVSET